MCICEKRKTILMQNATCFAPRRRQIRLSFALAPSPWGLRALWTASRPLAAFPSSSVVLALVQASWPRRPQVRRLSCRGEQPSPSRQTARSS
jgi:hypothetical protein